MLSGFDKIDRDTLFIVKKIVGNYVKKYSEQNPSFRGIYITLDTSGGYRVTATVIDPPNNAEAKEDNLVFALGTALNRISMSA